MVTCRGAGARLAGLGVLALAVLFSCADIHPPREPDRDTRRQSIRRIGYFASWTAYGGRYSIDRVPAEQLTHLLYAFAGLNPDGAVYWADPWIDIEREARPAGGQGGGNLSGVARLRERNPGLRVYVSLGGWTGSRYFSVVAGDPRRRAVFCESVLAFLQRHDFDGVDLDWEFPVDGGPVDNYRDPEDGNNLGVLLEELHRSLSAGTNPRGGGYGISLAVSPLSRQLDRLPVGQVNRYCEFMSLMTYNYRGSWDNLAGHASPLLPGVSQAVRHVLERGFEPARLVVGIPFFARGWTIGEPDQIHAYQDGPLGLRLGARTIQASHEPPKAERDGATWNVETILGGGFPGLRFWDSEARAACSWDPASGVFVSHEDERSVAAKVSWVLERGLGGVMYWELSGDAKGRLTGLVARMAEGAATDAGVAGTD